MTLDMKFSNQQKKTVEAPEQIEYSKPLELAKPKKKKRGLFVILGILVIVLGGIGFVAFKGIQIFEKIGLKIDSNSLSISNKEPELKKDSTGKYTNFLIVGVDKEQTNTDTIMVVSYNYDTKDVVITSIPRDFYVETCTGTSYFKINAVYYCAKGDQTGLQALVKSVKEVTGIDVQYYALVNFTGFKKIIDAVGGVDINVETAFTDYFYPSTSGETGSRYDCFNGECGYWKKISFAAGVQHMNGTTALEYARSRHSAQDGLDYGRAKRQQNVVLALKDKIMSTSTLTSPKAILGIISSVASNLKVSEFTINDIQAGLNIIKAFDENSGKAYSFILDPNAGNSQLIISSGVGSDHQEPKLGLGKYTEIQRYVSLILAQPQLYNEDAKIYVYNVGLGTSETTKKVQALKTQFPFLNIVYKGTLYSTKEGSYIYSHTENSFTQTVSEISTYLGISNKTKPEYITTKLNNEDVTILLGKEITQLTQE